MPAADEPGEPLTRILLEDHEHAELLVADELVSGAGGNEHGVALPQLDRLGLRPPGCRALEHDVDLVVGMGLLMVGLGSDENVDADFEAGRLVDDLVAAVGGRETLLDARDVERMGNGQRLALQ